MVAVDLSISGTQMRVTTARRKKTSNKAFLQSAKRASLIAALLACCSTARSDELSSGLIDSAELRSLASANQAAASAQHATNSLHQHQAAARARAATRSTAPVGGSGYLHQSPYTSSRGNYPVGNAAAVAKGLVQSNPFMQPGATVNTTSPNQRSIANAPLGSAPSVNAPSQSLPTQPTAGRSSIGQIGQVQQNRFATTAMVARQQQATIQTPVAPQQPKSLAMLIRRQPDAQLQPVPQPQRTAVLPSQHPAMQSVLGLAAGQSVPGDQGTPASTTANTLLLQSDHHSGTAAEATVVPAGGPVQGPTESMPEPSMAERLKSEPLQAELKAQAADVATSPAASGTGEAANTDDESILQVADARDQQKSVKASEPIQFSLSDGSSVIQAAPTDHAPDGGVIREILPPRFGKRTEPSAPTVAPTAKPETNDQSASSETEPLPFDLTPKRQPAPSTPRVSVARNVGVPSTPAANEQDADGSNQMIRVAKPQILQHGKTAYAGGTSLIQLAPGVDFAKQAAASDHAEPHTEPAEQEDADPNAKPSAVIVDSEAEQRAESELATTVAPEPAITQQDAPAPADELNQQTTKTESPQIKTEAPTASTESQSLSSLPIADLQTLPKFPSADLGLTPKSSPAVIQETPQNVAASNAQPASPAVASPTQPETASPDNAAQTAGQPNSQTANGNAVPPAPQVPARTATNAASSTAGLPTQVLPSPAMAVPAAPTTVQPPQVVTLPASADPAQQQRQPLDKQRDSDVVRGMPRAASNAVTPSTSSESDNEPDDADYAGPVESSAVAAAPAVPVPTAPAASEAVQQQPVQSEPVAAHADTAEPGEQSQEVNIVFAEPKASNGQVTNKHWVDGVESPVKAAPETVVATEDAARPVASTPAQTAQVNPQRVNAFTTAANRTATAPRNTPVQQQPATAAGMESDATIASQTNAVPETSAASSPDMAAKPPTTEQTTPALGHQAQSAPVRNQNVADAQPESSHVREMPEATDTAADQVAGSSMVKSADEPTLPTATGQATQSQGLESIHSLRTRRTVVAEPPPAQLVGPVQEQVNVAPSAVSSAPYDPASMQLPTATPERSNVQGDQTATTAQTPETTFTAPSPTTTGTDIGGGEVSSDVRTQPSSSTESVTRLRPAPTPRRSPGEAKVVTVDAPDPALDGKTANAIPIQLSRAQVRSMTIGGRLRQFKIDDDSICQVFHSGHNQIRLIGTSLGKTYLTVWADVDPDQTTRVQTFLIDVSQNVNALGEKVGIDTQLLNTSVARAFPGARALVSQQNGVLIVSGSCPDDQMATQLLRMVRKSCRIPVIDRLSVQSP